MNFTVKILYPAAASSIVEPSGRVVWNPDGAVPWVHVGTEIVASDGTPPDEARPENVAEIVWARWNRGSGHESTVFFAACRRSLSVGDMVLIPEMETALRAASFGWDVVSSPLADEIADGGADLMDIDYSFRARSGS